MILRILLPAIIILSSTFNCLHAGGRDSLYLTTHRPSHINRIIPGVAGLTAAAFLLDETSNSYFRNNQTSLLNTMSDMTDMGGEKKIVVPGLLLTYGASRLIFRNERLQSTSLKAMQSVIVTAISTEGLKYLGGRARPFNDEGPWSFNPLPGNIDRYKSLPSGHASLSFALFTPFAETYSRWIYLIPVSVAWGRVYQNKHWFSDVVVGGGIGLISGYLFTHHDNIRIVPNGLIIYL